MSTNTMVSKAEIVSPRSKIIEGNLSYWLSKIGLVWGLDNKNHFLKQNYKIHVYHISFLTPKSSVSIAMFVSSHLSFKTHQTKIMIRFVSAAYWKIPQGPTICVIHTTVLKPNTILYKLGQYHTYIHVTSFKKWFQHTVIFNSLWPSDTI